MSNDELFELVAVLTAKNMALEEEIKRLNKQTDQLIKDLNECNAECSLLDESYLDHSQYPSMEEEAKNVLDEDDSDYYPPHPGYVPGDPVGEELRELIEGDDDDSDWNYPNHYSDPKSVEVDLLHKINALKSKVVELGESIWKRVGNQQEFYLANKSKIEELDRWTVSQSELADRVSELDQRLKGTNYELVKVKKLLIEEEEDNG